MATTATPLKTASVLAFERKLDPSDALFHAGLWAERDNRAHWTPVPVNEKSVRGTISNRLKNSKDVDPVKLDASIQKPNLQTVDVAALPADKDTLRVSFTLRVLAGTGQPSACNDPNYLHKLLQTVRTYIDSNGFGELARRYAHNLANGRFLWRNRIGAEAVEVRIGHLVDGSAASTWTFDALQWPLREFTAPAAQQADLDQLAGLIADGLAGRRHVLLDIEAYVRLGRSQEVFPSQELLLDKDNAGKIKTLYKVNGIAGIHSQKIGNALRTIDSWHPDAAELGPIAVEPYGSVTTLGKACRQPKKHDDFYSLLDNWLLKDQVPPPEQQHYVIATLIRGGVFGDAEKG